MVAVTQSSRISRRAEPGKGLRAVKTWLYILAALVTLMVAIGGATRLTGSGLSITEWRPVTGAIPPISPDAWAAEFSRYQASPQYRLLNEGMSLGEFKFIYWWEWSHRQLGRLIGFVFFLPLLWFWARGVVGGRFVAWLIFIGALGGLQAAIGWIMVASGLQPGMTAVAPVKLMLHLIVASVILALIVWTAAGLGRDTARADASREARTGSLVLLALIFMQIALGAVVAGSRSGLTFNTWPLMDGHLVPPAETLFAVTPWFENFVDNPALVQFDHRIGGYAVVLFALWHMVRLRGADAGTSAARRATSLAAITLAQVVLGVTTLILVVPFWAALAHQLLAMVLLMMASVHVQLSRPLLSTGPLPAGRRQAGTATLASLEPG